jgi:hypothetical protein
MHRITNITITPEILKLIAEIDEFKGRWTVIETLAPEKLTTLRRIATIESVCNKVTGGSGTGPVASSIWGSILTAFPKLADLFGVPTVAVGAAQGMAAYTSNYVDGVCNAK